MDKLAFYIIIAVIGSVVAWFSYIVYTLLRSRNTPQQKDKDLVLIKSIRFEIDGLKDRVIELYKRTEVYEIHDTDSPIIVVTIGEAVARMKHKQIFLNYRQACLDMDRIFKVVVITV
jgi:hypothetical protein